MIKEIDIKGKKYPVKVSFNAEKHLQKEYGISPSELEGNLEAIECYFYYSIQSGCKETGQEFDLKREDIPFILDDCLLDFMLMLPEFQEQMAEDIKKKRELLKKG